MPGVLRQIQAPVEGAVIRCRDQLLLRSSTPAVLPVSEGRTVLLRRGGAVASH